MRLFELIKISYLLIIIYIYFVTVSDPEDAVVQSGQPYPVVWHRIEQLRSLEQWQSWTAVSGQSDECDDPERCVPFTDLSPYLFSCGRESHLQFRLVVGSLQSLGVPLLPGLQIQHFWAPVVEEDNVMHLLSSVPELVSLPHCEPTLLNNPSYLAFIRQVILQARPLLVEPYRLEVMLFWFHVEGARIAAIFRLKPRTEASRAWKETKGWIKNLLKTIPPQDAVSTLSLYCAYAAAEACALNVEESARILQMLLTMYSSNPFGVQENWRAALLRTWLAYIQLLVRKGCLEEALSYLVALGAGSAFSVKMAPATPAMTLKARRKYESLTAEMSYAIPPAQSCNGIGLFHLPDETVDLIACYSLFLSLTDGSLSAFEAVNRWLVSSTKDCFEFCEENRFNAAFVA